MPPLVLWLQSRNINSSYPFAPPLLKSKACQLTLSTASESLEEPHKDLQRVPSWIMRLVLIWPLGSSTFFFVFPG